LQPTAILGAFVSLVVAAARPALNGFRFVPGVRRRNPIALCAAVEIQR